MDLLRNLVAFLTVFVCFCACEANLFGPESREIGGGYRLKRADNHNGFALIIPHESGGFIIDEIRFAQSLDRHRTFLVLSDLRGRFGRADR